MPSTTISAASDTWCSSIPIIFITAKVTATVTGMAMAATEAMLNGSSSIHTTTTEIMARKNSRMKWLMLWSTSSGWSTMVRTCKSAGSSGWVSSNLACTAWPKSTMLLPSSISTDSSRARCPSTRIRAVGSA